MATGPRQFVARAWEASYLCRLLIGSTQSATDTIRVTRFPSAVSCREGKLIFLSATETNVRFVMLVKGDTLALCGHLYDYPLDCL